MTSIEATARLIALLEEHSLERSNRVEDWPEQEREFFRDSTLWDSFDDREKKLRELRLQNLANAITAWRFFEDRNDKIIEGLELAMRTMGTFDMLEESRPDLMVRMRSVFETARARKEREEILSRVIGKDV